MLRETAFWTRPYHGFNYLIPSTNKAGGPDWADWHKALITTRVRLDGIAMVMMVLGSATSLVLVGMLYDGRVSVAASFAGFAVLMVLAALLMVPVAGGEVEERRLYRQR